MLPSQGRGRRSESGSPLRNLHMDDVYYTVAHRSQEEIDSFKSRYQTFNASVIAPIFKKHLNLTISNIRQATSWGSSHVIYFVDVDSQKKSLVFRANTGFNPHPEVVMLVEKMITDDVARVGVPTNKILFVDVTRREYPFDYQIEEMLEGSDIEDNFKGTQEEYDKLSFELGRYVAKFHSLTFPGFGKFDEKTALKGELKGTKNTFYEYLMTALLKDLEYLVNAEVITDNVSNSMLGVFEDNKEIINSSQGVLVHHDLADHNIMFDGSKITGIFDWEACVVGDPVLDLASAPTWKTHYPREEKMLEGYQSITPLPDNFEVKKNIYKLRTMIWKMVYAIRAGILDEARKQKFYAALKPFGL